jgi:hypothetical protein
MFLIKLERRNIYLYWVALSLVVVFQFIGWILIKLKSHILKNLSEMGLLDFIFIFLVSCLGFSLGL